MGIAAEEQKLVESADQYMPIKALNQFSQDWRFKARVVQKPAMREYKNDRGGGKIMNLDLIDREGTMIQGTMFNETAIAWYDKVLVNKVYVFSGGQIKMANKRFTSIKNDFCLTFDRDCEITECAEDQAI